MKKLLPFLFAALVGLASCSHETANQKAVAAYLKNKLDDPSSYESLRWGIPVTWRQHNADSLAAIAKMASMQADYAHAQSFIDSCKSGEMFADEDTVRQGRAKRSGVAAGQRVDTEVEVLKHLQASTDTTRLGVALWHSFRAKNKLGALVLDSAHFVVSKAGVVSIL